MTFIEASPESARVRQTTRMQTRTELPFGQALSQVMGERGLTFRRLEEITREEDPEGRGLTNAYLNQLTKARAKVSMRGIEVVASALALDPCYFLEYRAELVRQYFDRDRVDPSALAPRLQALEKAMSGHKTGLEPLESLLHRLRCDDDELPPALKRLQRLAEEQG